MKTVSVAEARSKLRALLDEVSSGQQVSLVRRGREVAHWFLRAKRNDGCRRWDRPGIDSCDGRAGEPDGRPHSPGRALLMSPADQTNVQRADFTRPMTVRQFREGH